MSIINLTVDNKVLEAELNRPHALNAINTEMSVALCEMVERAKQSDVRAVLIYGSGKGFCAGGDLKNMGVDGSNPFEVKEFLQTCHEALAGLYELEKPVITAVHGPAVGAGANLAFVGDMVLADETASFGEVFVNVGALPDFGGLYFLPYKVGMHKAAEMIFTGKVFNAREALDYGLINQVVSEGEVLNEARKLAQQLAGGPTKALGLAKRLLHRAVTTDLRSLLDYESLAQSIIFQTADHEEGKKAFIEKRKPQFKGF